MKQVLVFILTLLFVMNSKVLASYVSLGDKNYLQITKKNFTFIYSEEYASIVKYAMRYIPEIQKKYELLFGQKLKDQVYLVFASPKNQIANAFAHVSPHNVNVYYGGGASLVDNFAIQSWIYTLMVHEMAHLYQLDAKRGLSKFTKDIFGHHTFFVYPFIPVPVFVTPNVALPTWIIEGNATFNESIWGNGGRLYSGHFRAMFYSLLREGKLNESRLTNNELAFPFTTEKYIIGGYFSYFLSLQFGLEKVNRYFYQHADHFWNPLRVNSSFDDHFGIDYSNLIAEFLKFYYQKAKNQNPVNGKILAKSLIDTPLNSSNDEIIFITSDEGTGPHLLHKINKKTYQHKMKKTYLLAGKVFYDKYKKKYYTASSSNYNDTEIIYGLWDEDKELEKSTQSKIVLDWSTPDNFLYFDLSESFHLPIVRSSGDHNLTYKTTSSAVYDSNGKILYFSQEGKKRILMRNEEALYSYQGYYGKVLEGAQDEVYFIGPTAYGSGLFMIKNRQCFRLHSADTILDARKLNGNDFLIRQMGANGIEYLIIKANPIIEAPYEYLYQFEKYSSIKSFDKKIPSNKLHDEKSYNHVKHLMFSSWQLNTSVTNEKWNYEALALWNDPLSQNNLLGQIGRFSDEQRNQGIIQYLNQRFRHQWFLEGEANRYRTNEYDFIFRPGIKFLLHKSNEFQSYINTYINYHEIQKWKDSVLIAPEWSFKRSYLLSFLPYRYYHLLAEEEYMVRGHHKESVSYKTIYDVGDEWSLLSEGVWSTSNTGSLELGERLQRKNNLLPVISKTIGFSEDLTRHKLNISGGRIGLGIEKPINQGLYFPVFPFSLRRFAPLVQGQWNYFQIDHIGSHQFWEWGVGADIDLLVAHLAPISMRLIYLQRSDTKEESFVLSLSAMMED